MIDEAQANPADSPVRAILFDLSDVLVVGLTGVGAVLERRLGYPAAEIERQLRSQPLLGECTEDEYLRRVKQEYAWEIDLGDLKKSIREHFDQPVPGMVEIVTALAKSYPLYLLSDHGREWIEYIEARHLVLSLFTQKFYSFSLHMRKNDPATYRTVLSLMDCEAQECIFIDDRRAFLDAAARVDLLTILFEDSRHLARDLGERGVWAAE
jgi:HAD superfamily hydrolase (TIGR01509 family)